MSHGVTRYPEVERLEKEVERLKADNARMRKENDGLSDIVRTGGGRSSGSRAAWFLAGVGMGLVLALVSMLMWSHQSIDGPSIKMF
jgi:hypothetical protein